MKAFCYILSIYILVLANFPCSTDANLNQNANIVYVTALQNTGHQNESDACSPFCACTCSCCAGFILCQEIHANSKIVSAISNTSLVYQNQFIPQYTASIWQPPKIWSLFPPLAKAEVYSISLLPANGNLSPDTMGCLSIYFIFRF